MRILGIDYGDKRIGLAVSDPLGVTAQAIGRYQVTSRKKDALYFKELVRHYGIVEIVIGLPLRMDGSPGTRVEKTKEFADWLEKCLGLPITFWDERLTTKQALQVLRQHKASPEKRKKFKDQISAVIILSDYLESKRNDSLDSEDR
ncbi:MAG: Holliday junction resolvase RuvX [Candidatus Aminicenantes bacterium]|nr:Holliday junction resolvase RuvX [Candidatus Aminicenantes bacterium]